MSRGVDVGAREQNDSLLAVGIAFDPLITFELLVDDEVRGTARGRQRLNLAVQPHPALPRPTSRGRSRALDTQTRTIGLFSGSVASLDWTARAVHATIGQLIDAFGRPIADADATADDATAATDTNGFFQLQSPADTRLPVGGGEVSSSGAMVEG